MKKAKEENNLFGSQTFVHIGNGLLRCVHENTYASNKRSRGAGSSIKTEKTQLTKPRCVKENKESDFLMLKSSSGSESEQESDAENRKDSHCDAKGSEDVSGRVEVLDEEPEDDEDGSGQSVSSILLTQSGPTWHQRRKLESNDHKRKRKKGDSDVIRVSLSMRNQIEAYTSLKGEQVAARVIAESADMDEWFVVKVIHFDRETKEVEVLDEEGSDQSTFKLPMSCILPFPKRNDPLNTQEFPPGKYVLAVYPGTTALYKAAVISTPLKRKCNEYLLEFDDDEEDGALPQRSVPFHKVVALPEGHRH